MHTNMCILYAIGNLNFQLNCNLYSLLMYTFKVNHDKVHIELSCNIIQNQVFTKTILLKYTIHNITLCLQMK